MRTAGKANRVLNFLIDIFIISTIAVIITKLIFYTVFLLLEYEIIKLTEFELNSNQLVLLIFITYYPSFEYFYGKTLAKFLTNTLVANKMGMKPTFVELVVRTMTRLIPFEFVFIFFENRCLHDYFSRTFVVKKNAIIAEDQVALE